MYIYIYVLFIFIIYADPSWCMNIVPHSVSEYEQGLSYNEWRLVLLLRNVWPINVQQAEIEYNTSR